MHVNSLPRRNGDTCNFRSNNGCQLPKPGSRISAEDAALNAANDNIADLRVLRCLTSRLTCERAGHPVVQGVPATVSGLAQMCACKGIFVNGVG
jgi:hypothetical protein